MLSPIWGIMTSTAIARSSNNSGHLDLKNMKLETQTRRPAKVRSGRAQTFFVPDAGHAFERVDFVSAVEELDGFHFGDAAGVFELLRLEFVVILTGLEERIQKGAVRDADFRP